jgi:hypothetical protein
MKRPLQSRRIATAISTTGKLVATAIPRHRHLPHDERPLKDASSLVGEIGEAFDQAHERLAADDASLRTEGDV